MATPDISPTTKLEELDVNALPRTSRIDSAGHNSAKREVRGKSDYDLTDVDDVRRHLEDHHELKDFRLQRLSGGTANHVYRLNGEGVDAGKRWVLKHAAPQIASNPAFKLPQTRMDFEARILANELESNEYDARVDGPRVQKVPFIFYDDDAKLLCIQDAGDKNLKDAYATLGKEQVEDIGSQLGRWLANLHGDTQFSSVTGASNTNNQATHDERDVELGAFVNNYFGHFLTIEKESVCHGDFWPGNVMLQSGSQTGSPDVITVIDWEMVRVGNSATDVGQFAAEAFLLDRFYGGKGLHTSFIRAYFQSSAVKFGVKDWLYNWMTRVVVHFAAHIAFWPSRSVHWANGEDTKALIDMAINILYDALSKSPNAVVWRVFEGVPGLDEIAREMMVKRGNLLVDCIRPPQS